ncbi:MAG: histidine kinase [Bacteroidota bacterium]
MKKNLGSLLLYTFLFYEAFGPLRDYLEGDKSRAFFSWLDSPLQFLLVSTSVMAFMFYSIGAYLVLFYCYQKTSKIAVSVLVLSVVPIAIAFRYFIQEIVMRWLIGEGNYTDGYPLDLYFLDNLYYAFVFISFGVIMYFLRYSKFKEQQEQQLQIENQQIQLSLLRSQVNPHFLFNALNNIYALVNDENRKSLTALEKLSSMLRYSLYEQSEAVPLAQEWQRMEDYITLESMRLSYNPAILFDVPAEIPAVCVPPFMLIGLVENTFKHGLLNDPVQPVRIVLKQIDQRLQFKISNITAKREKDETGGIGLQNTRQRLALIYPGSHHFEVDESEHSFTVFLEIPAQSC